MENETTISIVLTVVASIGILSLNSLIDFGNSLISWIVLIATVVLIFIIFSIGSIKKNESNIKKLDENISNIKKDLNISERLSKLESYFDYLKMGKKGQIDILNLIRIAAIIILGYIILNALGLF